MTSLPLHAPPFFRTRAGEWTIAAVFLLMFVVLAWLQRVPSITTANDDATYVLLSRSLREGGYNSIHLVGAPIHTKYPPLFPALLAGVSSVAGESINAFAAVNIVLAAMALGLVFAVARRIVAPPVALGALAMAAANPALQGTAGTVMSEPAFLVFTALTLWALTRAPLTTRAIVLACVFATLAALTRTVGATLILAVLALLVLERRWRPAAVYTGLLLFVVVGASLWLRARAMPELGADYISEAAETATRSSPNPWAIVSSRVIANAPGYAGTLLWVLSVPTVGGTILDNLVWLVIAGAALAAGLLAFWQRWKIVAVFVVIYAALLLAWPWVIGRFLVPLLPLIALAFLAGTYMLVNRCGARVASVTAIALAATIAITGLSRATSRIAVRSRCDREQAMQSPSCFNADQLAFFAAARYVAEHTPPSSIVMAVNEGTFFYVAPRRLVPVDSLTVRPPDEAASFFRDEKVSYAVIGHVGIDSPMFGERLLSACDHLEPMAEFPPRTTVFQVLAAPTSDARACEILREYQRGAGEFMPQIF
jgi:4-amino-4-deoxy-L-arabinose transferase-like glycosyltransferase